MLEMQKSYPTQEIKELSKVGGYDHLLNRKKPVQYESKKIQRNDPCPCGSGKKYKNCHMPAVALKRSK